MLVCPRFISLFQHHYNNVGGGGGGIEDAEFCELKRAVIAPECQPFKELIPYTLSFSL